MTDLASERSDELPLVSWVREVPASVFIAYLFLFLSFSFYLASAIPKADTDALTYYYIKPLLLEFGALSEVATHPTQFTFPDYFIRLHHWFLKAGVFVNVPNFLLFFGVITVFYYTSTKRVFVLATALLLCSEAIVTQATGLKTDITLGMCGFFSWALIQYLPRSRFYLAICVASISLVMSIKWTGVFLIPPLGLFLLSKLASEREPIGRACLVLLAASPLIFFIASGQVYLRNFLEYGEVFPWKFTQGFARDFTSLFMPPEVILRNAIGFTTTALIETFDPLLYRADLIRDGSMLAVIQEWTQGVKRYYWVAPDATFSRVNFLSVVNVIACAIVIGQRQVPQHIRASAFIAVFYLAAFMSVTVYFNEMTRQLIPFYLFSIVPAAYLIDRLLEQRRALSPWLETALFSYAILVSSIATLYDSGRRMVSYEGVLPSYIQLSTLENRVARWSKLDSVASDPFVGKAEHYFLAAGGWVDIYRKLQSTADAESRLLVLNMGERGNAPLIYPYLLNRDPERTRVANTWLSGDLSDDELAQFDVILVFKGQLDSPHFENVFEYATEAKIYTRRELAAAGSPLPHVGSRK